MYILNIIAVLYSALNLSSNELQEFKSSYEILRTAKLQNNTTYLLKYGPDIAEKFDHIKVTKDTGDQIWKQYDSLCVWLGQAQIISHIKSRFDSMQTFPPTLKAVYLYNTKFAFESNIDFASHEYLESRMLRIRQSLAGIPIDTMYSIKVNIGEIGLDSLKLLKAYIQLLKLEWNTAKNRDEASVSMFARRFPGEKSLEIDQTLQSMQFDEINYMIRNPTNKNLIQLYKTLEPGQQRTKIKIQLESTMYQQWKTSLNNPDPEESSKAAQDFLQVFKDETRKSKKFIEIESWIAQLNQAQVQQVFQPAPIQSQQTQSALPIYPLGVK